MKRTILFGLALLGLTSGGCAEFDGFYDDETSESYRRKDWDVRERDNLQPRDDRFGAYGDADKRR